MTATIRSSMLEFINALQNEIMMFEVDPECSEFDGQPRLIGKLQATLSVLEHIFPMVQATDEILLGEISPKLFWAKWEKVSEHLEFPEGTIDTIGDDVTGFLSQFAEDDDDAETEGEDD